MTGLSAFAFSMTTTMDAKTTGLKNPEYPNPEKDRLTLAVLGHSAAGKSIFTEKLTTALSLQGVPIEDFKNYKNRAPRPSEVDGFDFSYVRSKEDWEEGKRNGNISSVEFEHHDTRYAFPKSFLQAIEGKKTFPIINLNLNGLSALMDHMRGKENRIVSIGLYCKDDDAQTRMYDRENLTREVIRDIDRRLENLSSDKEAYRKHAEHIRYLFYNPGKGPEDFKTLEHLVDRTLDLFRWETRYASKDNVEFRHQYVEDSVHDLFGVGSQELVAKSAGGEQIPLRLSNQMGTYGARHGTATLPGNPDDFSRVASVVSAYGTLTILLDETGPQKLLDVDGQLQRRTFLQEMLRIRLGVQQAEEEGPISKSPVFKEGYLRSPNVDMAFVSSFSPYDVNPLLITPDNARLPDMRTNRYHTLAIGFAYRYNGGNIETQPLLRGDVFSVMNQR